MYDYGPFDKPYGVCTKSGLLERLKGFCVMGEGFVSILIATAAAIGGNMSTYMALKVLLYAACVPFYIMTVPLWLLGMTWIYFPEFKPAWRQFLTW